MLGLFFIFAVDMGRYDDFCARNDEYLQKNCRKKLNFSVKSCTINIMCGSAILAGRLTSDDRQ